MPFLKQAAPELWQHQRVSCFQIIHAVFPSRRGLLPSVRALIDFLAQRFEMLLT